MAWVRRRYRGNKVWIEAGEDGALVLDARGLARLRYKPEDESHTYTVRPSEVKELGPDGADGASGTKEATDAGADAVPPAPRRRSAPKRADAAKQAPAPVTTIEPDAPGDDVPALVGAAIHVYTDGASSGNPGPAGIGVVLLWKDRRREVSRYLGETTNNVAELEAVHEALRLVKGRSHVVRVHTDSSYVIGVLTGGHRAKANLELVERIREEMRDFADLRLVKVEGHAGVEGNERADALARQAIRKR